MSRCTRQLCAVLVLERSREVRDRRAPRCTRSRRRMMWVQSATWGLAMLRQSTFNRSCQVLSVSSSAHSKLPPPSRNT